MRRIWELKLMNMVLLLNLEMQIQGVPTPDQQIEETDVLVLYGLNKDLKVFMK